MRYCTNCQKLYQEEETHCPVCHRVMRTEIKADDPVFVLSTTILELERITAVLENEKIPFATKSPKKEPAATIVTGDKGAKVELYVPYEMLEQAKDILIGIGALQPEETPKERKEDPHKPESFEEMGRAKRIFVRIISILLFILLVWAVVAGTDFVMDLIMGG